MLTAKDIQKFCAREARKQEQIANLHSTNTPEKLEALSREVAYLNVCVYIELELKKEPGYQRAKLPPVRHLETHPESLDANKER